jgi:hypothetical protein
VGAASHGPAIPGPPWTGWRPADAIAQALEHSLLLYTVATYRAELALRFGGADGGHRGLPMHHRSRVGPRRAVTPEAHGRTHTNERQASAPGAERGDDPQTGAFPTPRRAASKDLPVVAVGSAARQSSSRILNAFPLSRRRDGDPALREVHPQPDPPRWFGAGARDARTGLVVPGRAISSKPEPCGQENGQERERVTARAPNPLFSWSGRPVTQPSKIRLLLRHHDTG